MDLWTRRLDGDSEDTEQPQKYQTSTTAVGQERVLATGNFGLCKTPVEPNDLGFGDVPIHKSVHPSVRLRLRGQTPEAPAVVRPEA